MKTNTVVITQPNYLPWIGYFEQIKRSETFVFLDCVQFERREWQNRNRIKDSRNNEFIWLTVPTKSRGNYRSEIKDVEINYSEDWISKHLSSIRHNYAKAPFFKETFEFLEKGLNQKFGYLRDLNVHFIKEISEKLGLKRKFVFASDLAPVGRKTDLLIDICSKVGGDVYYSSRGAQVYMQSDEHKFPENKIVLKYQDYVHPAYPQLGTDFLAFMSAIDLLFNVGPDATYYIDSVSNKTSEVRI